MVKKLVWNVFIENINAGKIEIYNIFDHYRFMNDLVDIKKNCKEFTAFEKQVDKSLMYFYWTKNEWEIVVTSCPPYITEKEFLRLNLERNERIYKYGQHFRQWVDLETYEQIDIYKQIRINWDQFISYLWNNRNLIKRKK